MTYCLCFKIENCCVLDYRCQLQKHSEYLVSNLECLESGLLHELLTRRILSAAQVENIKSEVTQAKQNHKLVDLMIEKMDYSQYEEFLVSLWTTNQAGLSKYIISDGRG